MNRLRRSSARPWTRPFTVKPIRTRRCFPPILLATSLICHRRRALHRVLGPKVYGNSACGVTRMPRPAPQGGIRQVCFLSRATASAHARRHRAWLTHSRRRVDRQASGARCSPSGSAARRNEVKVTVVRSQANRACTVRRVSIPPETIATPVDFRNLARIRRLYYIIYHHEFLIHSTSSSKAFPTRRRRARTRSVVSPSNQR